MYFLDFQEPGYDELSQLEWICTNGLGSYASGTLAGSNTRKYHSLLVASFDPPAERFSMVSKIEERIIGKLGKSCRLNYSNFEGGVFPNKSICLEKFEYNMGPDFYFSGDFFKLQKSIRMLQGENTTEVHYKNLGSEPFMLNLNPLFVYRDHHAIIRMQQFGEFKLDATKDQLKIKPPGHSHSLYFHYSDGFFEVEEHWYQNFFYEKEASRGQDCVEDCFSFGSLRSQLHPGESVTLTFSTNAVKKKNSDAQKNSIINPDDHPKNKFLNDLILSGEQFIIKRKSTGSYSIIAGYPWFMDWGRDAMISIRGLCIHTGQKSIAESILETFLAYLKDGLIPNRFPDTGEEPEYNTIDASLWMFMAFYDYYKSFSSRSFIKKYYDQLVSVIDSYIKGTLYQIKVGEDGLLRGGTGSEQLTWMDAKVGDYVVTPRNGAPVEINALWYNSLCILEYFAKELNYSFTHSEYKIKIEQSFEKHFWNKEGYLNDFISYTGDVNDQIRSNQIYVLSLPFSILPKDKERQVLETVQKHLYTPLGLRSLAPSDQKFEAVYTGDRFQRDCSYHQGTVWTFMLSDFFEAYLKIHNHSNEALAFVRDELEVIKDHFYTKNGIHALSEIYDGLRPSEGRGTIHQAWSIATLVELLIKNPELLEN